MVRGDPTWCIRRSSFWRQAPDRPDSRGRSDFDAERYPEIDFRAAGIQFNGDDTHVALPGELTIKGVTRPIVLDGELLGSAIDGDGRERIAFALRGQLDRSDYGLVWNRVLETGNVVVGDTVDLILDVAAVRAA